MRLLACLVAATLGAACSAKPDTMARDSGPAFDAGRDAGAALDAGVRTCRTEADCNDSIMCTIDSCEVGNVCQNMPVNALCDTAMGETCSPTRGCIAGMPTDCTVAADCQDGVYCNGDERCIASTCVVAARPVDCDDGNSCTIDSCAEASHACSWMAGPGCDAGTPIPLRDGGVPPRPFDPTMDYTGTFTIVPPQSVGCGVVSYNITSARMSITGGALHIQADSIALTQTPAPVTASFDATLDDGCGQYRMMGTFDDSTGFTGMWTARFVGACASCAPQSAVIVGFK